jgi:hypothetical protein
MTTDELAHALKADYFHAVPTPRKPGPSDGRGYRPKRASRRRRANPGRESGATRDVP